MQNADCRMQITDCCFLNFKSNKFTTELSAQLAKSAGDELSIEIPICHASIQNDKQLFVKDIRAICVKELLFRFSTHIKAQFPSIRQIRMFQREVFYLFAIQKNFLYIHILRTLIDRFNGKCLSVF